MLEEFIEAGDPYTDQQLEQICKVAGFSLPRVYCEFAKKYGDAFVGGLVDASPDFPVSGFFSSEKVISNFEFNATYKENRAIPVADCELGNIWVLSEDGSVHFINFYSRPTVTTKVASSFQDFLSRISIEDE